MPADVVAVSESGLRTAADIMRLQGAAATARFLIGERFMTHRESGRSSSRLLTRAMFVKVCGITRMEDAAAAVDAGARALGFVFWPDSPRFVDPYRARAIVAKLPPFVTPVGVFVNQPHEYVNGVASLVRLGAVQLHGDETIGVRDVAHGSR